MEAAARTEINARGALGGGMFALLGLVFILSSPLNYDIEMRKYGGLVTGAVCVSIAYLYLIRFFHTGKLDFLMGEYRRPVLIFSFFVLLSCVYGLMRSNNPVLAASDLFQFGELVFFYFFTLDVLKGEQRRVFFLKAMFAVVMACAFANFLLNYAGLIEVNYLYVDDVFVYKVDGDFIPLAFVMLLSFYVDGSRKSALAPVLFLGFILLVLTYSRSYWLGALTGASYVMVRKGVRFILSGSLLAAGAVVFVLINPFGVADTVHQRAVYTIEQLFSPTHPQQTQRNVEFYVALNTLAQKPLMGIGLGGEYEAPIFNKEKGDVEDTRKHFIHNAYLRAGLLMGVPGLMAYLYVFRRLFRKRDGWAKKGFHASLSYAIKTAVVASLVISFAKADMALHPLSAFMGIFLGLADPAGAGEA